MNINALQSLQNNPPVYPSSPSPEIEQFAKDNGFHYTLTNDTLTKHNPHDYKVSPGWLGLVQSGRRKATFHVISGNYQGFELSMFLMQDILTLSDDYVEYPRGIVRVQLPKLFPQITLDSHKNDHMTSSVESSFKPDQKLHLEGDFDTYFDLFAPIGLQVDALSLLAPNMMQILMNHAGVFDVEFYGNEMILFTKHPLYTPETMHILDTALTEQLSYLSRLMNSWNYIPKQLPFDRLEKPDFPGPTLKIGALRIPPAVQTIPIFLLLGIMIAYLVLVVSR